MYHVLQLDAVFHVVDKQGHKVTDDKTIKYIEKVGKFHARAWDLDSRIGEAPSVDLEAL